MASDMPTVQGIHSQERTHDIFNLVCYFLKGGKKTLRHCVFETELKKEQGLLHQFSKNRPFV